MKNMLMSTVTILVIAAGSLCVANAQNEDLIMGLFGPDYPGLSQTESGSYNAIDTGQLSVKMGVMQYYRVNGEVPENWQSVEDSHIWQRPILGFSGEVIDPDDQQLDFLGDIYFDSSSITENEVILHELEANQGTVVSRHKAGGNITYLEQFEIFDNNPAGSYPAGFTMSGTYGNDQAKLHQFATLGCLKQCIELYNSINGEYPATIDALIDWGVTPVDRSSINPVTGQAYRFDGSEGDVEYARLDDGFRLRHVDEFGISFTY